MGTSRTLAHAKPGKRLLKPDFESETASRIWDWAVNTYTFEAADRVALILFCDAYSKYETTVTRLKGSDGKEYGSITQLCCKWFDRVYKMMIVLGMTPAQRKSIGAPPAYEGLGGLATRGMNGEFPDGDDEESE